MKALLTSLCLCFSVAAFSQTKADTFYVSLKAVDDYSFDNLAGCGVISVVVTVPFKSLTEIGGIKYGDKIDLIIACPEFYKGLKSIKKGYDYDFRIHYADGFDGIIKRPGYYLAGVGDGN